MGGAWRPWRALRERDDIDFVLVDMPRGGPHAYVAHQGDVTVIAIDRRLTPAERLVVLAHELVHDERGGSGHRAGLPARLCTLVAREERRVDNVVATRLIDPSDLEAFVTATVDMGEPVEAWHVAEAFAVSHDAAQRALALLEQRRTA